VADYKSAYEREKKDRKEAEKVLEDRSRELYKANARLNKQVQEVSSEFQKNALLLKIFHYSLDSQKLSDSLPSLIISMLTMAHLPMGVFDYYPLDRSRDHFRSEIYTNDKAKKPTSPGELFDDHAINHVLGSISVEVLSSREMFYLSDLEERLGKNELESFRYFGIGGILAFPVVANNHTAAIIYLFLGSEEENIDHLVVLFESSIKQLGILIEHRYSSDLLEKNYSQLKNMVGELDAAQKQLVHAEKMASIGQLSAGIAHEINNPMGYVKSNLSSLKDYNDIFHEGLSLANKMAHLPLQELSTRDDAIDDFKKFWMSGDVDYLLQDSKNLLEETANGIDRVLDIVSGLRSFARPSDQTWGLCDVNNCLEEALKLSNNQLKYKCVMNKSLLKVAAVNGNAGELVQVFLNLLINAGQAIDSEGEINVCSQTLKAGVEVRVSDNGCGIDDSVLLKIFDPCYTTKEVGQGTGLGLSISFGIIDNHGGRINVISEKGEGSCFSVWLPAVEQ